MGLVSIVRFIIHHPLSRGRKLANLGRFARWQIGARLVPGPVAVHFVNAAQLLVSPGLAGVTGNVYVGLHEFVDMAFVLHFLRPDDLFVDVGANIGSYTILATAGVGANCIAFEPGPDAWEWLCKNINLNGVRSMVDARRQAVSSTVGTLHLTVGMDSTNHIVYPATDISQSASLSCEVQATTLDKALESRHPIMIKIDVEGFETEVVSGGCHILEASDLRCVLVELAGYGRQYGFDENALRQRMVDLGFESYQYDPFTRCLKRDSVNGGNKRETENTLFIRDIKFVRQRVESAAAFTVRDWKI
jgi:FkbM family methyltransferase